MYSNDSKKGFSILDLVVKIIFAGLFIFILVWLFQKKVPNMKPFYSNVFRENIKYMQEAGESYFTDDKMPTEVGDSRKLTLAELFDKKMVLPFVDEDGNSCNQYDSYVMVTKLAEGYELKTNLVCQKESDYQIKILGCHNYCPTGNCVAKEPEKTCTAQNITKYQFKKQVTNTKTTYSCPDGFKLKGSECTKTTVKDTKDAETTKTSTRVDTKDARLVVVDGTKTQVATVVKTNKSEVAATKTTVKNPENIIKTTKKTYVNTIKTTTKKYVSVLKTTTKKYVNVKKTTTKKYHNVVKTTVPASTRQETFSCTKYRTERKCTTTTSTTSYSCNCTSGVGPSGKTETSCSTCYSSVPVESCNNVSVPYTATCTKTINTPASVKYSCPSGTTAEGSGSSLKCYTTEVSYSCPDGAIKEGTGANTKCYTSSVSYSCPSGATAEGSGASLKCSTVASVAYSCPSGATAEGTGANTKCYTSSVSYSCKSGHTAEGSGANLKCYSTSVKYGCPSGATAEGSGSSIKCYKSTTTYSCPENTVKEGSGSSTKCYKVTSGTTKYVCDGDYKLDGSKCKKTVTESKTSLNCPDGYKLEGKKCNLYTTETKKATANKKTTKSYKYTWSTKTSLSGWERTGKTKTEKGKTVCE